MAARFIFTASNNNIFNDWKVWHTLRLKLYSITNNKIKRCFQHFIYAWYSKKHRPVRHKYILQVEQPLCPPSLSIAQVVDEGDLECLEGEQARVRRQRPASTPHPVVRPQLFEAVHAPHVLVVRADAHRHRHVLDLSICRLRRVDRTKSSPASLVAIMWTSRLSCYFSNITPSSFIYLADSRAAASVFGNSRRVASVGPHR